MHSVLFVASTETTSQDVWRKFVEAVAAKLRLRKGALRLGENVWLLDLQIDVAALGWLVALAEQYQVAYGILPFRHAPEWLPAEFDPKTISGHSE